MQVGVRLLITLNFAGWFGVSILLTLYNKWLFAIFGMKFPLLITSVHILLRMPLAIGAMWMLGLSVPSFSTRALWSLVAPIGWLTALDIGLSNASFLFVTVTYYTIVKSSSPLWVLLFSVLFRLQRPSFKLAGVVVSMVAGIGLASAHAAREDGEVDGWNATLTGSGSGSIWNATSVAGATGAAERLASRLLRRLAADEDAVVLSPPPPPRSIETWLLGLLLLLAASACSGLRWVCTQMLLDSGRSSAPAAGGNDGDDGGETPRPDDAAAVHPLALLLVTSPFGVALLGPPALWLEYDELLAFQQHRTTGMVAVVAIGSVGGVAAFFMLLFELRIVQLASGLTLAVAGVFKEVLTILSAVIVMGDTLTLYNVVGLAICTLGLCGYQQLKRAEMAAAAATARDGHATRAAPLGSSARRVELGALPTTDEAVRLRPADDPDGEEEGG